MVLNKFELEILRNAVIKEREMFEKEYITSIKNELDKNKYNDNNKTDYICMRIGETSKNLQVINGILIKLEGELDQHRY